MRLGQKYQLLAFLFWLLIMGVFWLGKTNVISKESSSVLFFIIWFVGGVCVVGGLREVVISLRRRNK